MTKVPKEVDNLCIKVGSFIEYWGFKKIEGRIWCHLLLSNRALCPQDLMQLTGVSKGLVSISLTRLMDYNVVRIEHKRGRRTQYYQVNENVIDVIRGVLISRESKLLEGIEQSVMEIWKNATVVTEKKLDPVGKEDGDIDNDGDKDSSDKYLAKRRKAISKSMKKEEEEVDLDESNPAKMSDDVLKSRLAQMEKSLKIHVDSPATQFEIKRLKKEMKKRGIQEEVDLDEAFKISPVNTKLNDGSMVKISKDDASALNGLYNSLNPANAKTMIKKMMQKIETENN